jgi:hypothetical protein
VTALRFFVRRNESGNVHGRKQPVHTGDPDRMPNYAMCGVAVDDGNWAERSDPKNDPNARTCVRCAAWRELAEERAARVRGIVGGWEAVDLDGDVIAWKARDSIGRVWLVEPVSSEARAGKAFGAVVVEERAPPPRRMHVRKLGHTKRSRWKNDAAAMAACEELARSGEFVLDRPPTAKRGAA